METGGGYNVFSENDIWTSLLESCTITVPLVQYHCTDKLWQFRLSIIGSLQHILRTKIDNSKSWESNDVTEKIDQELGPHELGGHGGESTFTEHHSLTGLFGWLQGHY